MAFFHAWKATWAFFSLSFVFLVGGGIRGSSFSNSISGAGAGAVAGTSSASSSTLVGSIGSEWISSGRWALEKVEKRERKTKRRALFEQWWAISDSLGWPKAQDCGVMRSMKNALFIDVENKVCQKL